MRTKLSICIPTYNRAPYLRELLDSIYCQDEFSKIEVAIADNASTDETEILVHEYQARYGNITYYKWNCNMGADLNFIKAVEIASGEYCWLMGSDDVLTDKSIANILKKCNFKDVYLFCRIEADINLKGDSVTCWLNNNLSEYETSFKNAEDSEKYFNACCRLGGVFSYLSSIVVKKESWQNVQIDKIFIGTAYIHTHIILKILKLGGCLKYYKIAVVKNRSGNDAFLENMAQRILLDFSGYSQLADATFNKYGEKRAFLNIVKRDYSYKTIIALGAKIYTNMNAWKSFFELRRIAIDKYKYPQLIFLLSVIMTPFIRPILLARKYFGTTQ